MTDTFQSFGMRINGVLHLSAKEAYEVLQKGAILVDVREEFEMNGKRFAVPKVVWIPFKQLAKAFGTLPRDVPLIVADSVGMNSKEAVVFLSGQGYGEVASLNGGIIDWQKDGLPTDVNDDEMLVGQCACKLRPKKTYRAKTR